MSVDTQTLTFQEVVKAEPKTIYNAFTNQAMLNQWLCNDARINASKDGRLYLYWNQGYYTVGKFTEVEEDRSLAFSWCGKGESAVSHVTVNLESNNGGTKVNITHDGLGTGEEWQESITELTNGWQNGLANLKSVLEQGLDKRIYDRPLLGVIPTAQISEEQAADLGLPVKGGVRISGTVPNTGAAKAGLQADDIITQIDDTDITGFAAFAPAVAGKNVGAEMGVVFYRDNHKHTVTMPLSPRPAPNVPDNPADFADQVQQLYAQLDAQLDELLASVSDEEASISPTEGEWSVKEILCHLIASERGTQFGIAVQLGGQALTVFPNNPAAPTAALLAVYPTLAELVHVWKQTEAETVALVKNLPPEYAARKVDYLNNGLTLLLGNPGHTQSHFREMQRALETVRSR
jgi:uncharacterized protein YndB with AHSA1/START domain